MPFSNLEDAQYPINVPLKKALYTLQTESLIYNFPLITTIALALLHTTDGFYNFMVLGIATR